jgi:hypothetical protein
MILSFADESAPDVAGWAKAAGPDAIVASSVMNHV